MRNRLPAINACKRDNILFIRRQEVVPENHHHHHDALFRSGSRAYDAFFSRGCAPEHEEKGRSEAVESHRSPPPSFTSAAVELRTARGNEEEGGQDRRRSIRRRRRRRMCVEPVCAQRGLQAGVLEGYTPRRRHDVGERGCRRRLS